MPPFALLSWSFPDQRTLVIIAAADGCLWRPARDHSSPLVLPYLSFSLTSAYGRDDRDLTNLTQIAPKDLLLLPPLVFSRQSVHQFSSRTARSSEALWHSPTLLAFCLFPPLPFFRDYCQADPTIGSSVTLHAPFFMLRRDTVDSSLFSLILPPL